MNRNCRGLTLIELMATTVLAGLLMTSLLQVITMTGRTRDVMDTAPLHKDAWQARLTDRLQTDLEQALDYSIADGVLQIEGWAGWDRATNEATHEPARITYRVVASNTFNIHTIKTTLPSDHTTRVATGDTSVGEGGGGGGLLVREQRDVLDLGQQRPAATLMAMGVESLSLAEEENGSSIESDVANTIDRGILVRFVSGEAVYVPLPAYSGGTTHRWGGDR